MSKLLKMAQRVKLLVVGTMNLLIQGAEAGAATAALLAQAHNLIGNATLPDGVPLRICLCPPDTLTADIVVDRR